MAFNVGNRVRVIRHIITPSPELGEVGTVVGIVNGKKDSPSRYFVEVNFDDGRYGTNSWPMVEGELELVSAQKPNMALAEDE